MEVDPNLTIQAYQNMLSEANHQIAMLKAAATQLQEQVKELSEKLAENNQSLMVSTGRQDGIPQETASPAS